MSDMPFDPDYIDEYDRIDFEDEELVDDSEYDTEEESLVQYGTLSGIRF